MDWPSLKDWNWCVLAYFYFKGKKHRYGLIYQKSSPQFFICKEKATYTTSKTLFCFEMILWFYIQFTILLVSVMITGTLCREHCEVSQLACHSWPYSCPQPLWSCSSGGVMTQLLYPVSKGWGLQHGWTGTLVVVRTASPADGYSQNSD